MPLKTNSILTFCWRSSSMMMISSTLLCFLSSISINGNLRLAHATQIVNDPAAYFGGIDHEDYLAWIQTDLSSGAYEQSVFLANPQQNDTGVAVHWYLQESDDPNDLENDVLHLALATRATGWVGFGISEAGGMLGSDMVLFQAADGGVVVDAHVVEDRLPVVDCSQDWNLVHYNTTEDGFLFVLLTRLADTGDFQDKVIVNDLDRQMPIHRVIAAWGDDATYGYHGPDRVARGAIRFYTDTPESERQVFDTTMAQAAEGRFVLETGGYTIPDDTDTTYASFCLTKSQILAQGVPDNTTTTIEQLYLIGLREMVDQYANVHHLTIYGITNSSDDWPCEPPLVPQGVYGWALGMPPMQLPDDVGLPILLDSNIQAFLMEIHYDNAALKPGIVDHTAFEFFWTTQPRTHDMGLHLYGDPFTELNGTTVSPSGEAGAASHTFECPSTCTSIFLSEPVTVFAQYHHMHALGSRQVTELVRDGQVVQTTTTEVWEFDQTGNLHVQVEPYQVLPGDVLRTTCYWSDLLLSSHDGPARFGYGSAQEMCLGMLWYYPLQTFTTSNFDIPWTCGYDLAIPICQATHEETDLTSAADFGREFGVCNLGSSGNKKEPKWWQCLQRV